MYLSQSSRSSSVWKLLALTLMTASGLLASACGNNSLSNEPSICNSKSISAAISQAIAPNDELVNLDKFECANNFAYAFATIGPVDGNLEYQISVTMVLKFADSKWAVQDRSKVCGTAIYGGETAEHPKDALVPKSIWQNACQTN